TGQPRTRQISAILTRSLAAILLPAIVFSMAGIAVGNSPALVREEALLWVVAGLMTTITLLTLGSGDLTGLSLVLLLAATVAALIIAVSIDALGLGLTYTRTLIGAAAVGSFIALAAPLGMGVRPAVILVRIAIATAAVSFLLSFTFGQSDLSAGQALVTRFVG